MTTVLSLGDALIDFVSTQLGTSLKKAPGFYKDLGGGGGTLAVGLSRLEVDTRFVGKVGKDDFGRYITDDLIRSGVNTSYLQLTEEAPTTLKFSSLAEDGTRSSLFYRNPGTDQLLNPEEVTPRCVEEAGALLLNSIILTASPGKEAAYEAIRLARAAGTPIFFYPEIDQQLWSGEKSAKERCREVISLTSGVITNERDAFLLGGSEVLSYAGRELLGLGTDMVIVLMETGECYYRKQDAEGKIRGYSLKTKDEGGGTEAFTAGLLAYVSRKGDLESLPELGGQRLAKALKFANASKAVARSRVGASSSMPDRESIEDLEWN